MRGHTQIARLLRRRATPAETRVWRWLRDRRYGGWKFRRQHPLSVYVLDFYCAELRLAIELDGAGHQHPAAEARDRKRTAVARECGVEVLRVANQVVLRDPDTASEIIRWAIERAQVRNA